MNKTKIKKIFERFSEQNANPTIELNYTTPFELLIAVILSAQSTDVGVNKATKILYPIANTPQGLIDLGEEQLKTYIKTIGLYHSKAKNIIKTCAQLLALHAGEVPNTREALEALPGVGRKTANVILNTIFGQPTIAVDTHLFRVANRIGLVKASTPLEVENQLMPKVPKEYIHRAHHWLVLHGRYTCIARKPKCPTCIIRDLCEYKHKTRFC